MPVSDEATTATEPVPLFAELGGAEASLYQQGLGPKYAVGDEITSTRERAVSPCPLNQFKSQCVLQLGDVL